MQAGDRLGHRWPGGDPGATWRRSAGLATSGRADLSGALPDFEGMAAARLADQFPGPVLTARGRQADQQLLTIKLVNATVYLALFRPLVDVDIDFFRGPGRFQIVDASTDLALGAGRWKWPP